MNETDTDPDRPTSGKELAMQTERTAILIAGTLLMGMVLFTIGCSRTEEPDTNRSTPGRETAMKPENRDQSFPEALPPIDAAAPRTFETATFGLG